VPRRPRSCPSRSALCPLAARHPAGLVGAAAQDGLGRPCGQSKWMGRSAARRRSARPHGPPDAHRRR
jgi:hypothetical protein